MKPTPVIIEELLNTDLSDRIGKEEKDENGTFRMIDDKKIYQIEAQDEHSRRINDAINAWRCR